VLFLVALKRCPRQIESIIGRQIRLSVGLVPQARAALQDESLAALVEQLGRTRLQRGAIQSFEEAHAHKGGGKLPLIADHPPRQAASFIVQRAEKVPSARGLILDLPTLPVEERRILRFGIFGHVVLHLVICGGNPHIADALDDLYRQGTDNYLRWPVLLHEVLDFIGERLDGEGD
jgi:hypothetical protein